MAMRLKRYQKDFEHSYACGVFSCLELLEARAEQVVAVLVASRGEPNAGVARIRTLCLKHAVPVTTDDKAVERLAPGGKHLALGVFKKYHTPLDPVGNHVVLVNPGDMGNVGTICRTMLGFGVTNLALVRPAVDVFDPRTVRASMGAVFRMSVEYFEYFEDYRTRYEHHLYPLLTNGRQSIRDARFQAPFALVFGNESSGLPAEFRDVGASIRIPQDERVDSLNLAVAVAIALYESAVLRSPV